MSFYSQNFIGIKLFGDNNGSANRPAYCSVDGDCSSSVVDISDYAMGGLRLSRSKPPIIRRPIVAGSGTLEGGSAGGVPVPPWVMTLV